MLLNALRNGFDFASIIGSLMASLMLIFLISPMHELAHGFVAIKLGDDTPRWQGRMTLNPMAHIDYMGALFIILFGFGWAKPVQVNMRNFENPKRDMALCALAGPVSNLLAATVFGIFLYPAGVFALKGGFFATLLFMFLQYFIVYNIYIALFNLIPIPPLDGSRILNAVLPDRYYYKLMMLERYSFIIILVLFNSLGFSRGLSVLSNAILTLLYKLSILIF